MSEKRTGASDRQEETSSQNPRPEGVPANNAQGSTPSGDETQANIGTKNPNEVEAVKSDGSATSPPTPSASAKNEKTSFYGVVYSLSKRGRGYLFSQLVLAIPSLVLIFLGFKPFPSSSPLVTFIEQHPVGSPIIGGILLLITLTGLLISYGPEPQKTNNTTPNQKKEWYGRLLMLATATSTTCCIFSTTILIVVLARPPWCPTLLCSPLKTVTTIATNPKGIHDANLELYFLSFQSSSYVITDISPGKLATVPGDKDPRSIGAVRIDSQSSSLYRVVLEAHSLYQGKFSILIDHVTVLIKKVPPGPRPLRVLTKGPPLKYEANPYQVLYIGQEPGQALPARYLPVPYAGVQLSSGESDQLDVQLISHVPADIQFQMQVKYHIAGILPEKEYTLTLPTVFEVVFSDAENWHQYLLQAGRFVPTP